MWRLLETRQDKSKCLLEEKKDLPQIYKARISELFFKYCTKMHTLKFKT